MIDHPFLLFLCTNCIPLVLVVGALDFLDAALFVGLIFVDFYWQIFRLPDRKLDISHPSSFEM